MYFPHSKEVIVCLVTLTAFANSSCDNRYCLRSSGIFVFKLPSFLQNNFSLHYTLIFDDCQAFCKVYFANYISFANFFKITYNITQGGDKMKFNEYLYTRPNMDEIQAEFTKAYKLIQDSNKLSDVINAIDEINKVRSHFSTMSTLCSIRNSINTKDEFYEQETAFFDLNSPNYSAMENEFLKILVQSKFKAELIKHYGKHLFAMIETSLKAFSPEIIEELQIENKLVTEYSKIIGGGLIEFDGQQLPLSMMAPYNQSTNRDVRKRASDAVAKFFEENDEKLGNLYDQLVKVRDKMAKKLGYENYLELGYARLGRTDYDAKMVENYRKQIYESLVPLVAKLSLEKAERIGVANPYSYDFNLSFLSGNPSPKGNREWLVTQAKTMYHEMSKETAEFFDYMIEHDLMDLDAKAGKDSGGYCTFIEEYKSPFIFANFNGTSGDVDVLTHEAGHAFQVYTSKNFSVPEYYFPTLEACEIHSMSMEFFAWPWTKLFFKEDNDKYHYSHLADSIIFIPYGATVDEFQHIVYQNPEMTPAERKKVWREIEKKYLPYKKYDNQFLDSGTLWYRQGHIFSSPFYYIDYTLAQVCAHQFWIKDHKDHEKAWKDYYHLCTLGGSKSFLELLKEANLQNPFNDGTIKAIVGELAAWLNDFDKSKLN